MMSNLSFEKGHHIALEALALLRDQGIVLRLRLAGKGTLSDEERVDEAIRRLDLSNQVDRLGPVPDADAFYRSIDAFLVPSVEAEGLPTTILEALASGLPVLASDVGGAAEVITDQVHGRLLKPGDPGVLANALRNLVTQPRQHEMMAAQGRARVLEVFTTRAMTRAIVAAAYPGFHGDASVEHH